MKKLILILAAIGFITTAATTKMSLPTDKMVTEGRLSKENRNAFIEACNKCIKSCSACETVCLKDTKMPLCTQFCKECVNACKTAAKVMGVNNENAKQECEKCIIACEKCASECEMFATNSCKACAADCRTLIELCNKLK
ncbi:MAG TPA: hypothetical protein VNX01_09745 [Bacteroidia bacterium]|jgi:hypothetical protein|nr:hypothetical protein [Bacteroidia bacterium]